MTRIDASSAPGDGYAANGFPPELKGRVAPGRLFIDSSGARFESPQARVTLPIPSLTVRVGGHNNEQLFFEHPHYQGWSIVSSDARLVHDPVLRELPGVATQLRAVQKSRTGIPKPVIIGLALLAVLFGFLLVLILQKDRIVSLVVDRIPITWEENLGDQVFEQVQAEGTILESSEWEPALEQITARLLPVVSQSGYNFRFHIMQDTNVNAFAIPGGNVVILTGLLEAAKTPEEIAGVLAHELAHVTERHSMRQMVQSAGLWVVITAFFGDTSGMAAVLTEGSQFLLRQRFSRVFEREADDKGWDYLIAAEIDPRGLKRFFEMLKKVYESEGTAMSSTLAFLQTHPATNERIERLEQKWADLEKEAARNHSSANKTEVGPGFLPFDNWTETVPKQ